MLKLQNFACPAKDNTADWHDGQPTWGIAILNTVEERAIRSLMSRLCLIAGHFVWRQRPPASTLAQTLLRRGRSLGISRGVPPGRRCWSHLCHRAHRSQPCDTRTKKNENIIVKHKAKVSANNDPPPKKKVSASNSVHLPHNPQPCHFLL